MEAILNDKAEKIKEKIKGTAEQSKKTIREMIETNTKYIGTALDSNRKIVESIHENFNQHKIEDTVTGPLQNAFGKSVELAEDALDSIINSYTRQMELNVDFNTKLVDAVKESDSKNPAKVLNIINDNFEASRQLTTKNTKELLEFYNKHTNLAVNFNQKFGESIHAQMETLFQIQSKGLSKFTDWASDWWSQTQKETAKH
jgi:sugar-specific transcriptional regulator TrmB